MSKYAQELHSKLKDYKALEYILDNPRVEKFRAFGFNAINLSGIIVSKTSDSDPVDSASLITVTEIDTFDNENKIFKITDYIRYKDGNFSEVDQNISSITSSDLSNVTILSSAIDTLIDTRNEYLDLEADKATDKEIINCESRLTEAVGLAYRIFTSEESLKKSLGEYGPREHQDLMQKLGALVLDLDAFYGPKN